MKDFEIIGDHSAPKPPRRQPRTPPSNRPAWFFRVLFIAITLLALLFTAVVIRKAVEQRGTPAAPDTATGGTATDQDAATGEQGAEIATGGGSDAAEPTDSARGTQAESVAGDGESTHVRPFSQIEVGTINEILRDQERIRSGTAPVYSEIAHSMWNIGRLIQGAAKGVGVEQETVEEISPIPVIDEDGPYFFWTTSYNAEVIKELSRTIFEATPVPNTMRREFESRYAEALAGDYMGALNHSAVIIVQTASMVPSAQSQTLQQAQNAVRQMENQTGHILAQAERNHRDAVAVLHRMAMEKEVRSRNRTANQIQSAHAQKVRGNSDTLVLIAAHLDATVQYLALLFGGN